MSGKARTAAPGLPTADAAQLILGQLPVAEAMISLAGALAGPAALRNIVRASRSARRRHARRVQSAGQTSSFRRLGFRRGLGGSGLRPSRARRSALPARHFRARRSPWPSPLELVAADKVHAADPFAHFLAHQPRPRAPCAIAMTPFIILTRSSKIRFCDCIGYSC